MGCTVDQLIDAAERIGVIGSPSSTSELSLDILASAVTKKLVGELALFRYLQENSRHYALGQITEIALRNIWHEDPTMRSLIRQRGRVDAVSERQDTHQGKMLVSAVFAMEAGRYQPSMMGTVPPTGTSIHLTDDRVLCELLAPYQDQLFYLGHVYGSTPRLPLWFKHFDTGPKGVGEAYHFGIFGKTGSGKSVLAKMVLLAYAKHHNMGLFVFDPQGEFSKDLRHQGLPGRMGQILCPSLLTGIGRKVLAYDLSKIQLDRWDLFTELLIDFGFFFDLGIKTQAYQEAIADYVQDLLRNKFTFADLDDRVFIAVLNQMRNSITRVYAGASGVDRVQGLLDDVRQTTAAQRPHPVKEKWDKTIRFFKPGAESKTPTEIVRMALALSPSQKRPMIVVDLSQRPLDIGQNEWDDKVKPLLIDRFLDELTREAERAYKEERSLNTLVVLDEAHRLAQQERYRNERAERIKSRLVDAVRTTRKYGLGWLFLSQTLSSLDSEIVQQLRILFLGFGLSMGTEYQRLRELVSDKESIGLYQRFRDPQASFDASSREYAFMTVGPISPLSFAGTPLFLKAFNTVEHFIKANQLSVQDTLF